MDPLQEFLERAEREPLFIGYAIANYQISFGIGDEALADLLGMHLADLDKLRLCRTPKDEAEISTLARVFCLRRDVLKRLLSGQPLA